MNGSSQARAGQHGRHDSQSSIKAPSAHRVDTTSYVQRMRMAKATVWAERGPKDAVSEGRKLKTSSSTKKARFGMKMFNGGPAPVQYAKPPKTKLRLYAAPQHTTLVPRLSASEANDIDDFDNFASAAPMALAEKRTSNSPSLAARSSLHQSMSRGNSIHTGDRSAPSSPGPKPSRMDSVASSVATSSLRDVDDLFTTRRTLSPSQFNFASGVTTSRSGSPTQLQQYTMHHISSDSDDEDRGVQERPKLFVANADISDSD